MKLFYFAKDYIVHKAKINTGAYLLLENKKICIQELTEALDYDFLYSAIKNCRNKKYYTISNYKVIVDFCKFIKEQNYNCKKNAFSDEVLSDFLWISTCQKSNGTKKCYLTTLIPFIEKFNLKIHSRVLKMTVKYKYSSTKELVYMKTLTKEEISDTLIKVKNYSVEQQLAYQLLLRTGIRVSELVSIRLNDIYFDNKLCYISILGKRNLKRVVPIKKLFILELYKKIEKNSGEDFLIKNRNNKPASRQSIYNFINKLFAECKISKFQNGPHLLRHTYATNLYNSSKDLILTQETLGHTSLVSTCNYIHKNKEELKKQADLLDIF